MTSPRRFVLEYPVRPWTTNAERKGNHWQRATRTKEWRQAFAWLAHAQRIPAMTQVEITAEPWQQKGVLADTAACHPAVKAAIDGIVDAGVIPDDNPNHLLSITFLPTRKGRDALILTITETSTNP